MIAVVPAILTAMFVGSLLYLASGILFGQMNVDRSVEWIWLVVLFVLPAVFCPVRIRMNLVISAVGLVLVVLVYSFGLAATVSVFTFFAAAFAAGTKLRSLVLRTQSSDIDALDLPLGLCAYTAIFGVLAQFVYLDRSIVALSFVVALWLGREGLKNRALRCVAATLNWSKALSRSDAAALAFSAGIVCFVALGCFMPTVGFDDHAYHLRLWTELANSHRMALDPVAHVFALAPFSTDILYALPNLIAGEDTRGLVNLALLLLTVKTLYIATRVIPAPESFRLLCVALFASTPLLLLATTTLQTEMWATFYSTQFAAVIVRQPRGPLNVYAFNCLALAALLASTKLTGVLLGAFLLVAALIRMWDAKDTLSEGEPQLSPFWTAIAFSLLGIVALQSYVAAWVISGNPVFPLFNGIFKSPFFDATNFSNSLFTKKSSIDGFIGMFWNTHEYLEARDGVAGFQYLFVLPLAGVALLASDRRSAPLLALFLATILFAAVSFSFQQYVRYLLPIMPVASLLLLAAFPAVWVSADAVLKVQAVAALAFCILITILNVTFAKGSIWYLETGLAAKIMPSKRQAYLEAIVPEWRANAFVNAQSGRSARVFYDRSRPYGATLAGVPLLPAWYNPSFQRAALGVKTAADVERLITRFGVTHVFWDTAWEGASMMPAAPYREPLADYLATHGVALGQFGRIAVYAVNRASGPVRKIFDLADPADVSKLRPRVDASELRELRVNSRDRILSAQVARGSASVLRIEAQFECESRGVLLIQLNWSKPSNPPHYRLVACEPNLVNDFIDVVQAPLDEDTMTLYFNTHASSRSSITIRRYLVEGR